jgi:hypothetical protein
MWRMLALRTCIGSSQEVIIAGLSSMMWSQRAATTELHPLFLTWQLLPCFTEVNQGSRQSLKILGALQKGLNGKILRLASICKSKQAGVLKTLRCVTDLSTLKQLTMACQTQPSLNKWTSSSLPTPRTWNKLRGRLAIATERPNVKRSLATEAGQYA